MRLTKDQNCSNIRPIISANFNISDCVFGEVGCSYDTNKCWSRGVCRGSFLKKVSCCFKPLFLNSDYICIYIYIYIYNIYI